MGDRRRLAVPRSHRPSSRVPAPRRSCAASVRSLFSRCSWTDGKAADFGLQRFLDTTAQRTYHEDCQCAEVAQLVEHSAENAGVVSSILTLGTTISIPLTRQSSGSSSVVEHFLAKEGVGGSNPLSRSRGSAACPAAHRHPHSLPRLTNAWVWRSCNIFVYGNHRTVPWMRAGEPSGPGILPGVPERARARSPGH